MTQNRKPPAYQEYASTMLADIAFRSMNMESRGLLYTLRLECWANQTMPSDVTSLSSALGKTVSSEMFSAVESFFDINEGKLTSPELESYRAHLEERRQKQSRGGKKGAKMTNEAKKVTGTSRVPRRLSNDSLVKKSTVQQSKTQHSLVEDSDGSYNSGGSDSLEAQLYNDPATCPKCLGEGCGYCG